MPEKRKKSNTGGSIRKRKNGLWEAQYIAGRKEWAVNVSYLVMTSSKVRDLLLVGQTFGVTVRDTANTYSVSGTAIMTAVKHVSTVGNLAQGSFSLKGTGALV